MADLQGKLGVEIDTSQVLKAKQEMQGLSEAAKDLVLDLAVLRESNKKLAQSSKETTSAQTAARKETEAQGKAAAKAAADIQAAAEKKAKAEAKAAAAASQGAQATNTAEEALKDMRSVLGLMGEGFDKFTSESIQSFSKLKGLTQAQLQEFIELENRIRSVANEQQRAERDRTAAMRASEKAVRDQNKAFEEAERAVKNLQNSFRGEIELLKQQRRALEETKDARLAHVAASLRMRGASEEMVQAHLREIQALRQLEERLGQAEQKTSVLGFSFQKTGQIIYNALAFAFGFGIYNSIQLFTTAFIDTARAFDQTQVALKTALGTTVAASAAFDELTRRSAELALPILDTVKAFSDFKIAAQGTNLTSTQLKETFDGFLVAAAGANLGMEQFQGVMRAVTQIMSKGKVQAEELRGQLGDRLPGAFALTAKALGLSMAELDKALKDGAVSAEAFATNISRVLKDTFGEAALARINTLTGAIQNIKNAFIEFFIDVNQQGASAALASGLNSLADALRFVNENFGEIKSTAISVTGALATMLTIVKGLQVATAATAAGGMLALIASTTAFGNAVRLVTLALNPMGLAITAVVAGLGFLATKFLQNREAANQAAQAQGNFTAATNEVKIATAAADEAIERLNKKDLSGLSNIDLGESSKSIQVAVDALSAYSVQVENQLRQVRRELEFGKLTEAQYRTRQGDLNALRDQYARVTDQLEIYGDALERVRAKEQGFTFVDANKNLRERVDALRLGAEAFAAYEIRQQAVADLEREKLDPASFGYNLQLEARIALLTDERALLANLRSAKTENTKADTDADKALKELNKTRAAFIETQWEEISQLNLRAEAMRGGIDVGQAQVAAEGRALGIAQETLEVIKQQGIEARYNLETQEILTDLRKETLSIEQENQALQQDVDSYAQILEYLNQGLTIEEATLRVNLEREESAARLLLIQAETLTGQEKEVAKANALAKLEKVRLKQQQAGNEKALKAIEDQKKAAEELAETFREELIENISEGIYRGFENGKGFIENLKDTLKNAFKSFALQVIVEPIVRGGVSALGGVLGSVFGAAGGSGAPGTAPSGASSLLSQLFGLASSGGTTGPAGPSGAPATSGGLLDAITQIGTNLSSSFNSYIAQSTTVGGQIGSRVGGLFGNAGAGGSAGNFLGSAVGYGSVGYQFGSMLEGQGVFGNKTGEITGVATGIGGAIAGPLGAAVGFAAGTLISGFMGRWTTESKKLIVNFTDDFADADSVTKRRKKRIGKDKKKTIRGEETELDVIINEVFSNAYKSVSNSAKVFGRSIGDDFNLTITRSIKKIDPSKVGDVLQDIANEAIAALVNSVAPFVEEYQKAGENLAQTFARIAQNFSLVSESLEFAGTSFSEFFKKAVQDYAAQQIVQGPVGGGGSVISNVLGQLTEQLSDSPFAGLDWADLIGAEALIEPLLALREQGGDVSFFQDILDAYDAFVVGLTESIVEFAGGTEAFQKALGEYTGAFFSEPERVARLQEGINELLAPFDLELPDTAAGFRQLVESLLDVDSAINITSEAGREAYATLLGLSAEAARVYALLDPEGLQALQDPRALIAERTGAIEQILNNFLGTVENLRTFRDSLRQQGQTPDVTYQELREKFFQVAAQANSGDLEAVERLQGVAQDFFAASENFFGAGTSQTEADRRLILEQIGVTIDTSETQADILRDQLEALNAQVDNLQSIEDILALLAGQAGIVTPAQEQTLTADLGATTSQIPTNNTAAVAETLAPTVPATPAVALNTARLETFAQAQITEIAESNTHLEALVTVQSAANTRMLAQLVLLEQAVKDLKTSTANQPQLPFRPIFAR